MPEKKTTKILGLTPSSFFPPRERKRPAPTARRLRTAPPATPENIRPTSLMSRRSCPRLWKSHNPFARENTLEKTGGKQNRVPHRSRVFCEWVEILFTAFEPTQLAESPEDHS